MVSMLVMSVVDRRFKHARYECGRSHVLKSGTKHHKPNQVKPNHTNINIVGRRKVDDLSLSCLCIHSRQEKGGDIDLWAQTSLRSEIIWPGKQKLVVYNINI
jgi:hypothetical protein